MNISGPDKLHKKTHRLTVRESRSAVIVQVVVGFMLFALTLAAFIDRHRLGAAVFGLTALMQFITLPALLKRHHQVKQGAVVSNPWLMFGTLSESVHISLPIKVALVGSLTILVAVVSYFSISSLHFSYFRLALHNHAAFKFLMFIVGFNLFLWIAVAFAWYLFVLTHKQEPMDTKLSVEQGNNSWPPAPLTSNEDLT